jgi:hypothetical protein
VHEDLKVRVAACLTAFSSAVLVLTRACRARTAGQHPHARQAHPLFRRFWPGLLHRVRRTLAAHPPASLLPILTFVATTAVFFTQQKVVGQSRLSKL